MEVPEENKQSDSSLFKVNRELIHSVEKQCQDLELQELDVTVYDQSTLEHGILDQVKDAFEDDLSLSGTGINIDEFNTVDQQPSTSSEPPPEAPNNLTLSTKLSPESLIEQYLRKQSELATRKKTVNKTDTKRKVPINRQRNGREVGAKTSSPVKASLENSPDTKKNNKSILESLLSKKAESPRNSSVKSGGDEEIEELSTLAPEFQVSEPKKRQIKRKRKAPAVSKLKRKKEEGDESDENLDFSSGSGSEYNPEKDDLVSDDDDWPSKPNKKEVGKMEQRKAVPEEDDESSWDSSEEEFTRKRKSKKELDDGDLDVYLRRIKGLKPVDPNDYVSLDDEFRVPAQIWNKLFSYQQEGVKWMWSLHKDSFGGILGDEMGLGKTIQMISFLAGLHYSNEKDTEFNCKGLGPSLIVCPTTIMHQWVREFHQWYPQIRVAILHQSGTFSGKNRKVLLQSIIRIKGILITSYSGVIQNKDVILSYPWHYVILDEGHKIRNPEAQVTTVCKNFDTSHRIILSGSPMQNNLKELWSLFDFIVPGKLGSKNIFNSSFVMPIVQGGYANASKAQVLTAFKCATALRDTIKPFLLRRSKAEVDIQLPGKKEQVLFCKLTDAQRQAYINFLRNLDEDYVRNNKGRLFGALVTLRTICNHPDIYTSPFNDRYIRRDTLFGPELGSEDDFGYWERSGKMIVLVNLLKHWHKVGGQKVLLFTQGKKIMEVLENFIKRSGYKYLKLDGGISISARQPLIDKFNKDVSYFIMLLTTKVGGLGVNLTGANKVVIFDPDWNPATDAQARERAWRIGQNQDVHIYRLLTTATIEEKIYHRQIYKEFLSNRILKNPKQRRFFKSNDLVELFTLNETVNGGIVETAAIFAGTGSEVKYDPKAEAKEIEKMSSEPKKIIFSKEKLEEMKRLAQEMSKRIKALASKNTSSANANSIGETKPTDSVVEIYGPDGNLRSDAVKNILKNNADKNLTDTDDKINSETLEPCSSPQLELREDSVPYLLPSCSRSTISPSAELLNHGNSSTGLPLNESKDKSTVELRDPSTSQSSMLKKSSKKKRKDIKKKRKSKHKDKAEKLKHKGGKYAKFEGEVVPHLVKYSKVKDKETEKEKLYKKQDDYILHKLLKKSGIDTALKHDAIMEDKHSDYTIVEEEASRVADQAVQSIQHSFPQQQTKNPLLKEIIAKIKERNAQSFNCGPQAQGHLLALIKYLNSVGGTASTDQIVNNFKEKVDVGQSPIFRKLLNAVSTFYRGPDSKGYWSLRDDFKSLAL